jgi:SIR2-like domain
MRIVTRKTGKSNTFFPPSPSIHHDLSNRRNFSRSAALSRSISASKLAHYLLLALPVRSVITTNYDKLLEDTLAALNRNPIVVVEEHHVARTGSAESAYVVKFHGDAANSLSPGFTLSRRVTSLSAIVRPSDRHHESSAAA